METQILDEREVDRFDEEVDVLVIGLGCAGACAALGASPEISSSD